MSVFFGGERWNLGERIGIRVVKMKCDRWILYLKADGGDNIMEVGLNGNC